MKTAIVHIGAHKTGSTSIQTSLLKSRDEIADDGFVYFNDYDRRVQLLSLGFRAGIKRAPVKGNFRSIDQARSASRSAWLRLARTTRRGDVPFTVISEEALLRMDDPEAFARVLHRIFDRVVVVAYVRNPISRYPSSVDQWAREGKTARDCWRRPGLLPPILPKLEKFEAAFGSANIVVRNFEPSNLVGGSPCSDFAFVLSSIAQRPVGLQDVGTKNKGLPGSVTGLLLRDNSKRDASGAGRTPEWLSSRRALIVEIRELEHLFKRERLALATSAPLLGHISARLGDEYRAISARYLKDQVPIDLPRDGHALEGPDLRRAFQDWIVSYRNPEDDALFLKLKAMVERPRL